VLFDLDGTLVDSAADLHAAMCRLCAERGMPAPGFAPFRAVVSKGARAMLAVTFPGLDAGAREALVPPFLAHYAELLMQHCTPFPGVAALLEVIERQGSRWGIVTNKPEDLARQVVAGMGWTTRSAILVGGDTLVARKPDPLPLTHACAELGVPVSGAVYVGDDLRDVQAANAAGMPAIVALWGYRGDDEDPATWGATALALTPLDLVAPAAWPWPQVAGASRG
jgi:phosphoglycolate phosphatase